MGRPTIDEVRERLLDSGVAVLKRTFASAEGGSIVEHIDLKEVAKEAGYSSPGMIYTAWTDQVPGMSPREGYVRDLTRRLISLATDNGDLGEMLDATSEDLASAAGFVRAVANESFATAFDSATATAFGALASLGSDTDLRAELVEREAASTAELAPLYDALLELAGRRYKPGITGMHLAVLLRGLERGLSTNLDLLPDLVASRDMTWEGEEGWTLFAVAVWEIVMGMSESADIDEDPR